MQPRTIDLNMDLGVFVKVIPLQAEKLVPQHSHEFPHVTVLVRGTVRVWKNGVLDGDYAAPCGILISAHTKHVFQTLTEAVLLCVHDVEATGIVEVAEEHQFEERV